MVRSTRPVRSSGRAVSAALVLVAITLAAYAPALRAGFVFDDLDYVTGNPALRSLTGLWRIWFDVGATPQYYPLTFSSFWLEYQLWGLWPVGYHLVNVLLHAANAVLLWRIFRRLRLPGAWVGAAIFALHPINVESVAWVTERKNVLSGAFALAALLLVLTRVARRDGGVGWRPALMVGALFTAALLSKTVTCTLPVLLVVVLWWQHGGVDKRSARFVAALGAAGLGMAALTIWFERRAGAAGPEWALSFVERSMIAGRAWWFYPRTLLWPHPLLAIYPRWVVDPHLWWQWMFPAAAVATLATVVVTRRWIGNGPAVALLCYTIAVAPALGFVNVGLMRHAFVADYLAYLPSIPLIALATAAAGTLRQRLAPSTRVAAAGLCMILVGLATLTAWQCAIYRDARTLWTDTLVKNPESWLAHNNLGITMAEAGDAAAAIAHYNEALRLKADFPEAHNNLGMALAAQGHTAAAIAEYGTALQLRPTYARAYNNLGVLLAQTGDHAAAETAYHHALHLNPDYAEAHNNLGNSLRARGRTDEAFAQYAAALQLRPDYPEAHNSLGAALAEAGRIREGLEQIEYALRLQPAYAGAHYNLATILLGQGRLEDAKRHFLRAIEVKPDYAEAHNNLGYLLFTQGQPAAAIAEYRRALQINPTYPDAQANLATALAVQGRAVDAGTGALPSPRDSP